jgi:hypothetical protein
VGEQGAVGACRRPRLHCLAGGAVALGNSLLSQRVLKRCLQAGRPEGKAGVTVRGKNDAAATACMPKLGCS